MSEVLFSKLPLDNEKFRLDSEFFQKKFINAYVKIKQFNHKPVEECLEILTDFHANGSYETIAENFKLLDHKDYAYMVRSTDLETNNYEDNVKYIDKHAYNFLAKSKLYGGELLINKIGSPGTTYLMPKLDTKCSLGMNLFALRFKAKSGINSAIAWLFFNTMLGKTIINRKVNGTVPLTIDKMAIKSLYLPRFTEDFNVSVENIVNDYFDKQALSKDIYQQAENLLLEELGMAEFRPSEQGINIKSLKNSFITTGRLDAEYYQPKYDETLQHIRQKSHDTLGNLVTIKKSIEPGSEAYQETGIAFYRVSNLTKMGLTQPDIHLDESTFGETIQPKKDTILLSKDGTVGMAYKLTKDLNGITSGALIHLNIKSEKKTEILADYLTLVLNSKIVQLQAQRDAGGSIIQHWKPSEIEAVIIPLLPLEKQQQISELIQQSFTLKSQSEKILENAKNLVEMAIEQGEEKAIINYELGLI